MGEAECPIGRPLCSRSVDLFPFINLGTEVGSFPGFIDWYAGSGGYWPVLSCAINVFGILNGDARVLTK